MAKSQKKGLKKLQAQVQEIVTPFKVNAKHVSTMATKVITTIQHAHHGVRDVIMTWKGERPETLEALKEEVKKQCKGWLKDEGKKINPQSIYNYQSDLVACCNGFQKYSSLEGKKKQDFESKLKEVTSYVQLVSFLRNYGKGKRADAPNADTLKGRRLKNAAKNHKREYLADMKDRVRYAPTELILAMVDFAEAIVEARKKGNLLRLDGLREEIKKAA